MNAVLAGQFHLSNSASSIGGAHGNNVGAGQFRVRMAIRSPKSLRSGHRPMSAATSETLWLRLVSAPALHQHVAHVDCLRSKKQVVRADATRIVAGVTHKQAVRNRAISQLIGHSGRRNRTAAPACVESPIAIGIRATLPEPTGIAFANLLPKAITGRTTLSRDLSLPSLHLCQVGVRGTRLRAVLSASSVRHENPSAMTASDQMQLTIEAHPVSFHVGATVGACSNTRPALSLSELYQEAT